MYFDDFIAEQVMKTTHLSASHDISTQQPIRRPLRTLWSGITQVAVDAFSRVTHRIDVPPDHGARTRPPPKVPSQPRP